MTLYSAKAKLKFDSPNAMQFEQVIQKSHHAMNYPPKSQGRWSLKVR